MDLDGIPTILAARPGGDKEMNEILIWKKASNKAKESPETVRDDFLKLRLNSLQILMLIVSFAFFWQNRVVRCRHPPIKNTNTC
jgi:hypothetical protein